MFNLQVLLGIYFFGITLFCYACFKYNCTIIVVIEVALLKAWIFPQTLWHTMWNFCGLSKYICYCREFFVFFWVCKTKTKGTTIANQKGKKAFKSQSNWKQTNILRRRKTRVNKSWLVLVLHVIGWQSGTSFLDQSQGKGRQNQFSVRSVNWKLLWIEMITIFPLLGLFSSW